MTNGVTPASTPQMPAIAEMMVLGAAVESTADIEVAADIEINRLLSVGREFAEWAGSNEQRTRLLQNAPLEYREYLEAVRNFNSWQAQARREEITGNYAHLPNDSEALRKFLSLDLPRGRFTPDAQGWRNYLADRYGMQLPEPKLERLALPERMRRYHTLVAGTTGAGKSELLKAIAHHYVKTNSAAVIVLDPHGALARQIAHFQEFQGDAATRLIYVAYEGDLNRCPILNPFDVKGLPASALDEYAVDFARVLGDTIPQSFTQPMADMLRACCRVLFDYRPGGKASTLLDLHRFVSPYPDDAADLVARGKRHADSIVAAYFRADFAAHNSRSTKEGLRSRLSNLLLYKSFRHMTCGPSTIDLAGAADAGAIVLFDLSSMGRVGGDTFGKLIVAQLVAHAMRRPEGAETTHMPIHLFVDEAQRLFTGTFLELLEQTRKKALYLTFAQQVAGRGFSGQDLESLMINTNVKLQGPGGCPPRMLDALNINQAQYRELFPETASEQQAAGGDFICKWGSRAPTRFFKVTREIHDNRVPPSQFAALLEYQHLKHYEPITVTTFEDGDISPADDPDKEAQEWQLL